MQARPRTTRNPVGGPFQEILDRFDRLQFDDGVAKFEAIAPPRKDAPAAERAAYLWIQARMWTWGMEMDMRKAAKLMQQALDADPDARSPTSPTT